MKNRCNSQILNVLGIENCVFLMKTLNNSSKGCKTGSLAHFILAEIFWSNLVQPAENNIICPRSMNHFIFKHHFMINRCFAAIEVHDVSGFNQCVCSDFSHQRWSVPVVTNGHQTIEVQCIGYRSVPGVTSGHHWWLMVASAAKGRSLNTRNRSKCFSFQVLKAAYIHWATSWENLF